ncbi:unnamed protein product [Brassica oleracea var. botrytis]
MTRLQKIPMVSSLISSSAPTTQTTQLNHGVHLSLKNPSVARCIALGLMSPDPPEPPDPPDLGSVMVTMGMDLRVVPAEEWWEKRGRDSSLDGERGLGLMVRDFLETRGGGSGGGGVICGVAAIAILNFRILLTFPIRFRYLRAIWLILLVLVYELGSFS